MTRSTALVIASSIDVFSLFITSGLKDSLPIKMSLFSDGGKSVAAILVKSLINISRSLFFSSSVNWLAPGSLFSMTTVILMRLKMLSNVSES
jgi:hypothetical protein